MNTANTTPAHVARAVMEGVTLGMAYGLRRMEELGVKPETIRLTGGGSNSAVWRRICADIFGYPVVTLKSSEGGALGAAIQALATAAGEPVADLSSRLVRVDEEARVWIHAAILITAGSSSAKTTCGAHFLCTPI